LSERPGLVDTNGGGIGHRLTRAENTEKEVSVGRSFRSESERETFGNGHDNQCYGNYQDVCEGDTLLGRSTTKTVELIAKAMKKRHIPDGLPRAQLHEEANHEGGEQNQTDNTDDFGDELGQVVQFLLQWSGVGTLPESYKNRGCGQYPWIRKSEFSKNAPIMMQPLKFF